ncbi:hypothetical protein PVV74_17385 [Roseovarius sp. SK2]|uniref:hypothetical protein n=1 Tax=Roseovarius TaxID=74030 RepID=UPI00237BFFCF|nr:hypothetical protein [Roseovarius sp. SK2]MDD9727237.1 hypothetical protein [Roseovarius sp. SK2]
MKIGQSAGKSYAYLLGVFLGDGCVTMQPTKNSGSVSVYPVFRLNTIDEDFALSTKRALSKFTDRPISIHKHEVSKSSKPNYSLRCGDPEICENLKSVTHQKKVIPDFVHDWSKGEKLAFIAGIMDSEGFVAANNSNPTNRRYYMGYKSCDVWVPEFIRVLESVGIKIGKVSHEKPRKAHYKSPTRFSIKMQSWIDSGARFNIARKQNRVDEWAAIGPYERRATNPRRLTSEANTPDAAC